MNKKKKTVTQIIPRDRLHTGKAKTETARNKSNTGLFSILRPYTRMVGFLVLFALLGNAANLIIPLIISRAVDSFSHGSYVFERVVMEFGVAATAIFFFGLLQAIIQTRTAERVAFDLRKKMADKISQQDFSFIRQSNPSKLLTNLTSDVDSVKMFVAQAVASIFSSVFMIVGTCTLLFLIEPWLALTITGMIPVIAFTFFFVLKKVRVLFLKSREVIDRLNRIINESILGSALVRVINSQHHEYRKFLSANTEAKDIGISILTLFATLIPVVGFVSNLATLAILLLGGHFVIGGRLSLGDFAAFNSYVLLLIFPIMVIGFMSNVIAQATASYERITKVLNAPEKPCTGTVTASLKGNICLKNVTVAYDGKPALKKVSLSIEAGSRTAIIGPTAAGKSQLLFIIAGIIRPDSGTITLDGIDIDDYRKEVFHKQVGFVFQDSVLFNLSMRENIAFGEYVDMPSMGKAIETADLKEFIDTLPLKAETMVSERGTSLSGGQKQRIMLARALAIKPKILLLDDFTSRVDNNTEARIMSNVTNNYPGITLVAVTQKIAPVKHFDQLILVMEGEVVAAGRHKDLLETCPEYVQIYNSQRSYNNYELKAADQHGS